MKFHMLMHLPSWTNNHVTCWALERHHKVVKRFLNNLPNTSLHYDTTILRDSTCFHLGVLKSLKADDFFQVGLLQGAPPSPQMEGALGEIFGPGASFKAARQARCNEYEVISIGDMVMGKEADAEFLGEVVQNVSVSTNDVHECFTILSCTCAVESSAHHARWSNGPGALQLVRTRSIVGAVPFARDADGLTTLRGGRVRLG